MDHPEQERRSMTRESARRPRKSRNSKAPQPELLSNQRQVAGEPGHQIARRTAEPVEASHTTLRYGTTAKIENRKPADEALRATEFSARMIVDGIPGLVALVSPAGEVEVVNRPLLEYFGKTLEEVRNWANNDMIYPDDIPLSNETFNNSLPTGRPFDVEERLRRFDGVYRWFQSRGLPLRDPDGRILHWYVLLTDIEERKQAEEKLRRSEAFLADGQRLSKTGTFSWSIEKNEIKWSQELYSMFDFDPATPVTLELIGSRVHSEDLPMLEDMVARARRGEGHFAYEHRIVIPDGSIKYIHLVGHTVHDANGRLEYIGAAQDVTQRRLAEEQLRERELNLRRITQTIPGMLWSATPEGEVDYCNHPWLEFAAMTEEQAKGWGWATVIYPDDRDGLIESWHASLASGVPLDVEARLRRFDGAYRWFLVRANPLRDESGNIIKWYGTNTDINDRKRAEADLQESYLRLAEAQRLSKTGSFITDLVGDDHNWSEETFRIFEFDPSTKVTVQMVQNTVHPDDRPSFESMISRAMTGEDVDFSFRILTPRGAVKHIRGMARVIEHVAGRPLFVGALQDVTESRLAEEALDKARSELAHVSRVTTLSALTASIAHEVNQPLSGVVTNADTCLWMLDTDPLNVDGARETVRRIIRDGNRAADVIARLRALFSKRAFTLEPVNLSEAALEVVALTLNDLQRNRVVLGSELADDLPVVAGDRVQLQQVILNLLRNAVDAMIKVDDRPRRLLIRTEREGADAVRLTVKDAGIGLDRQTMNKLFDAFYTTKSDGMGIGLSISRSIIERHQGRLWVEPNEGPGTTFAFSIPCLVENGAAATDTKVS
jgi:PAS domain S-box-containing protein